MVRYPYTLEIWSGTEAAYDPETGRFTETAHSWQATGACNARQQGPAQIIEGVNGEAYVCSYQVVMPASAPRIGLRTEVRICDRDGICLFDGKPRADIPPFVEGANTTCPVVGFQPGSQRNEDTTLWL